MTAVVGVDVGGTFTDLLLWEDGQIRVYKRPSTPDDPSRGVLLGLTEAAYHPTDVVHGSTVATNALLERRGATTALITTAGFRDALVIGRQARARMYALEPERPQPIVPASRRFAADERVTFQGEVLRPLTADAVAQIAADVVASGAESVAICLLFSFLHPEHEHQLAYALRERGLFVSASIDVSPEYREYERMSTTTINAYVSPVMQSYLKRLQHDLTGAGVRSLRVMQSDGGSLPAETAGELAVRTVLSGPAGGVAGAFAVAARGGYPNVITFDMGGTSTDVSVCPGRILYRTDLAINGLPIRTPAIDIHTVGAGGGSIATLDAGGSLRVGPESAGADPGPACYGNGGKGSLPTVTDAQLVLGRLRPDAFLGGRMVLVPEAARSAIAAVAGAATNNAVLQFAEAIVRVANANMEGAIRLVSVERGYDPRAFSLLAFGGAGPLHACDLADALRIPRVIVPPYPGVLSAFGMVVADITRDYVAPILLSLDDTPSLVAAVERTFDELYEKGRRAMHAALQPGADITIERSLDLRYSGQSYEVEVAIESLDPAAWAMAFHTAHEGRYGHGHPQRRVEAVNPRVRLRIRGPELTIQHPVVARSQAAPTAVPQVWFGGLRPTPVFRREDLSATTTIMGPAIVVQMDSTTVVNPGWRAQIDAAGNLILEAT